MNRLQLLEKEISACKRCPLYKTACKAVPGEGPISAKVMFLGEAPGREEDLSGRPFVGRAGKLLTQLIEEIGLKREDVFITSVIKHRPPKNRQPKRQELEACKIWWQKQIKIIKPKVLVLLGRFAFDMVVDNKVSLTKSRGKFLAVQKDWGSQEVFITYHPSAGLRFVRFKEVLKNDFKKIKERVKGF